MNALGMTPKQQQAMKDQLTLLDGMAGGKTRQERRNQKLGEIAQRKEFLKQQLKLLRTTLMAGGKPSPQVAAALKQILRELKALGKDLKELGKAAPADVAAIREGGPEEAAAAAAEGDAAAAEAAAGADVVISDAAAAGTAEQPGEDAAHREDRASASPGEAEAGKASAAQGDENGKTDKDKNGIDPDRINVVKGGSNGEDELRNELKLLALMAKALLNQMKRKGETKERDDSEPEGLPDALEQGGQPASAEDLLNNALADEMSGFDLSEADLAFLDGLAEAGVAAAAGEAGATGGGIDVTI